MEPKTYKVNENVFDKAFPCEGGYILNRYTTHNTNWEFACPFNEDLLYSDRCTMLCPYNKDKGCTLGNGVFLTEEQLKEYERDGYRLKDDR